MGIFEMNAVAQDHHPANAADVKQIQILLPQTMVYGLSVMYSGRDCHGHRNISFKVVIR